MDNIKKKIVIGALSHDIGKVLYREEKIKNHSDMGYDFLKNEIGIKDEDILNQVKYHHSDKINNANLAKDSLAYISYIADNISSMTDRRKKEYENNEQVFDRAKPLETIFNILNKNNEQKHYLKMELKDENNINMPSDEKEKYDESFYNNLKYELIDSYKNILDENKNISEEYINSYLSLLETWLSYIPSSTYNKEVADISLYDHLKITAAFATNIYDYLLENNISDYKNELYINSEKFYEKSAFIILSLDFSGIQDFIYMYGNDDTGVLKSLRVRSFYIEIMLENIIDEILEKMELTRTNILYAGGGHCYLLLANTSKNVEIFNSIIKEVNLWLLNNYNNKLYLSYGYSECSANDLNSEHSDKYLDIFKNIQKSISKNKLHKYSSEDIIYLNNSAKYVDGRECSMCKKTSSLIEDKTKDNNVRYLCSTCKAIIDISKDILDDNKKFYITIDNNFDIDTPSLPLPFNKKIIFVNETKAKEIIKKQKVRVYSKNSSWTGKDVSTKLWIADYNKKGMQTFKDLSNSSYGGYKKLAVLRADVDNLGSTFVNGFDSQFRTISRTATFSRNMSLFFKKHIKNILENPESHLIVNDDERKKLNETLYKNLNIKLHDINTRNISIVYSGGDDIFAVGAWDDIINFAIDLYNKFKIFTQGTLTFSCGIGFYDDNFPVYNMAKLTGELEDLSKSIDKKNAITLFSVPSVNKNISINEIYKNTYKFTDFIEKVVGDKYNSKYNSLKDYFANMEDKGRSFLYKLMHLVKNSNEKINIARLAYTLARAKPKSEDKDKEELFKIFAEKIFTWIQNDEDRKQLITAIELYGYYSRI